MKRKIVVGFFGVAMLAFMLFAGSTNAYIPTSTPDSTDVAIVPNNYKSGEGYLPTLDSAFDPFNFTMVAWADLNATSLAWFDIVVLYVDTVTVPLDAQQQSDLIAWINAGGKLIMYDAEVVPGVDWNWLPCPFNTSNPGPQGGYGNITLMEDNTLGEDNDPSNTFYYINTTIGTGNYWSDVVGDANIFTTFSPCWCGDIEAVNQFEVQGWVHAYAQYGNGLMIYNGFDTDPMSDNTAPDSFGTAGGEPLAKIWLLELYQPWGADYNLPCGSPVIGREPSVGGSIIDVNNAAISYGVMGPTIAAFLCFAGLAVLITLYRKYGSPAVQ